MGRSISDVIATLPAERQAHIEANAQRKFEEMVAEARSLADFRKAVGKTQAEVGKRLGIQQNAVSQLEKRSDIYLSTLQRFVESLGMKLQLLLVTKGGAKIDLPNFQPWGETVQPHPGKRQVDARLRASAKAAKPIAKRPKEGAVKKTVARKAVTSTARAAKASSHASAAVK